MQTSLKIGIIVFIGPLDRYGYQYNYMPMLDNTTAFATLVYLCSSTRNRNGVEEILDRFSNVVNISDDSTWFDLDDQGQEVFSLSQLVANINKSIALARADGMDCAAIFAINQYLPEDNRERFMRCCANMIEEGRPFEWMFKRIQLADRLFETDRRIPWLLNLHCIEQYQVEVDAIRHPITGDYFRSELGDFRDKNDIATVDVPHEMTVQDLVELRCFIRNYDEINPGVDPIYKWERDNWREVTKYNAKTFSSDPLSLTGQIIARNSRPDFVSHYLLQKHPANAPILLRLTHGLKARAVRLMNVRRIISRFW